MGIEKREMELMLNVKLRDEVEVEVEEEVRGSNMK